MNLFIGLMSGTSMDGIDAALVDVSTNHLIAGITRAYSEQAKLALQAVLAEKNSGFAAISALNTIIGREFAQAVHQLLQKADMGAEQITAVGSHGQTICHDAMAEIPYTVQLGCAHTIAQLTRLTVIADFRTRDLVVGGQGAPFAPVYHQALFGALAYPLAVVNIGGIANVSWLAKDCRVGGYDIGPGNCLMDAWVYKHLAKDYDAHGEWAASGEVIPSLLTALLHDPYFKLAAPKSIGKEYFSEAWLLRHLHANFSAQDIQATLLALTATTIKHAIADSHVQPERIAICGGGAHNTTLLRALRQQIPSIMVESTQAFGVDPDYIEAMMFAWLAEKTLQQIPVDLRHITGAKTPAILGAIYPYPR